MSEPRRADYQSDRAYTEACATIKGIPLYMLDPIGNIDLARWMLRGAASPMTTATEARQAAEIESLKLRIADQNDAIIRGTAITPDAYPHE